MPQMCSGGSSTASAGATSSASSASATPRDLGVIRGPLTTAIEKERYKPFYMHGTGHYLGLDVHDAGAYQDASGKPRPFEAGMVVTVEPGLYFDPKDRKIPSGLRGIGVRIEDDLLVTEDGSRNLTAACPKARRSVEAACRAQAR